MKNPNFISVLYRKLKPDCTYEDFYQAWLPPILHGKDPKKEAVEYFHGPVQVINAVNANDPTDVISIGIVWGTPEQIQGDIERTQGTEAQRREKILQVADKKETQFYYVKDVNLLGTPLPTENP